MRNKQVNAVMLGLGWMVSLGAVFILGILSAFALHLKPGAGTESAGDLTLQQRELALTLERYSGQPADLGALFAVGDDAVPEQLEQALRGILREPIPDNRRLGALRMVEALPLRRRMAAIQLLQGIPGDPARDQVLGAFLEGWGREDGRRALAFAVSLPAQRERDLATRYALAGWSQARPADAWNWVVDAAGTPRRAERWLRVVIANVPSAQTGLAFELLARAVDPGLQERLSVILMEALLKSGNPREAVAWLGEFPETGLTSAAGTLALQWAATEPEAAVEWVWSSFEGVSLRALMDAVADAWVAVDGPAPLAQWINRMGPDPSLDGAIQRVALATATIDPGTALVWTHSISDPQERSLAEMMVGRFWLEADPAGAASALPDALITPEARNALLLRAADPFEEEVFTGGPAAAPTDTAQSEDFDPEAPAGEAGSSPEEVQ